PLPRSRTSLVSGPMSRSARAISWPISLVMRLPSSGRLRMTSRQSALVSNSTGAVTGCSCLLGGDAGFLDNGFPLRDFFDDTSMEFCGAAAGCVEPCVQEALAHVRAEHDSDQSRGEAVDSFLWGAGRNHDALPGIGERSRYAGLADRRHIGKLRPALAAGHGEALHGTDADLWLGDRDRGRGDSDRFAEQGPGRGGRARVGDGEHLDAGVELEEFGCEMRKCAGARR